MEDIELTEKTSTGLNCGEEQISLAMHLIISINETVVPVSIVPKHTVTF